MMHLRLATLSCLVILPLAAGASPLDLASLEDVRPYTGKWTRIALEDDEMERVQAIDRATAGLSWLVRSMASRVLRSRTAPPTTVEFSIDREAVMFSQQGRSTRPLRLDGGKTSNQDDRGEFEIRDRIVDGTLVLSWSGDQARGRNTYRVSEDGRRLVLLQRVEVLGIDGIAPIEFRARFGRAADLADASR